MPPESQTAMLQEAGNHEGSSDTALSFIEAVLRDRARRLLFKIIKLRVLIGLKVWQHQPLPFKGSHESPSEGQRHRPTSPMHEVEMQKTAAQKRKKGSGLIALTPFASMPKRGLEPPRAWLAH